MGKTTVNGKEYWACGIAQKWKWRQRATALALVLSVATCDTSIELPVDASFLRVTESLTKAEVRVVKTIAIDRVAEAAAVSERVEGFKECQGELVGRWRKQAKSDKAKKKDIPMVPIDWPIEVAFRQMTQKWLHDRGLDKMLEGQSVSFPSEEAPPSEVGTASPILYYSYKGSLVQPGQHWEDAFHGTWFYTLWSILEAGFLLESEDEEAGHEFWHPGVYFSSRPKTAWTYARPQMVFGDGLYHRTMLKLRYDPHRTRKNRNKGGHQVVTESSAVSIEGVFFGINWPPVKGEERLDNWKSVLEVLPPGKRCRKSSYVEWYQYLL